MKHKDLHEESVDDGNGNVFPAFTTTENHGKDEEIVAFAFIYGDNGFGAGNGVSCLTGLKRMPDGKLEQG